MQHELLAPGFVIAGKYVVERTLGRGGMGAVYVVSHLTTGKRMALKCLLPEFVHNADIVGRFMREAQVMGRLQHRHVVDVFDVGRDGDVLYIVMELLEGKPLSDLLHDISLTLEETLVILLRAMEGVAAAHDHSIVHRDLKPDNIFICVGASGRLDDPRVLDFGISKFDDPGGQTLTRSGVAMGTPYYMSIEQLNGQRDLDQRVDVYAMGVILYEAIAGEPPFVADSVSALAIRVLTTQPVDLGLLRPDLPPGLAAVVMKAISRQREDRHRSMRQLIEALRPFVPKSAGLLVPEGQGRPLRTPRSSASPHSSKTVRAEHVGAATERPARRAGSSWWGRLGLLLAIALGTGAAALVARRQLPVAPVLPASVSAPASATSSAPAPSASPAPLASAPKHGAAPPEPSPDAPALAVPAPTPDSSAGAATPSVPGLAPVSAQTASALPGPAPAAPLDGMSSTRADAGMERAPSVRATSSSGRRSRAASVGHARTAGTAPESSVREPSASEPVRPSVQPEPRKTAEGRAGKLGSDQF